MKLPKRDQEASGPSNYLKIKDGDSVTGVFRGEAHSFRIKWENNKSHVIDDPNPANHNRWKLNFVLREGDKFVAKTWEFGITVYDQLSALNAEYDLDSTKVKVTRKGTGTDTAYFILPLLREPIPPAIMKEIEAVPLNILDKAPSPKQEEVPWPEAGDHPEIPF